MQNIIDKAIAEGNKYKPIKYNLKNAIMYTIKNEIVTSDERLIDNCNRNRHRTVLNFLNQACKGCNLNIFFYIYMQDSTNQNIPILTFSGDLSSNILMSDLYAIQKYNNNLSLKDNILYEKKDKKALFIGSTTGNFDAKLNERLKMCEKYRKHDIIHCYINNICQMSCTSVRNAYPHYNEFVVPTKSFHQMCKYKYIISIDGNTSCWDRIPLFLNSNSILLIKNSNHKCWYYDFLIPNVHYIPFDDDTNLEEIITSDEDRSHIIKNANQFVEDYLTYDKQLLYMKTLLETINSVHE
jgi:hypothetical protein